MQGVPAIGVRELVLGNLSQASRVGHVSDLIRNVSVADMLQGRARQRCFI